MREAHVDSGRLVSQEPHVSACVSLLLGVSGGAERELKFRVVAPDVPPAWRGPNNPAHAM